MHHPGADAEAQEPHLADARIGQQHLGIALAQATTYLATAPKSNAAYLGIEAALADIKNGRTLPVPKPLRSTGSQRGAQALGHVGYQYAHDYEGHFVDQEYLPTDKVYYRPASQGYEEVIRKRMAYWDQRRQAARAAPSPAPRAPVNHESKTDGHGQG